MDFFITCGWHIEDGLFYNLGLWYSLLPGHFAACPCGFCLHMMSDQSVVKFNLPYEGAGDNEVVRPVKT